MPDCVFKTYLEAGPSLWLNKRKNFFRNTGEKIGSDFDTASIFLFFLSLKQGVLFFQSFVKKESLNTTNTSCCGSSSHSNNYDTDNNNIKHYKKYSHSYQIKSLE